MTDKPERIFTRHYKNGIINARADDDPWRYPPSSEIIPGGEGEYIRADLGSFYQEKDIDALQNRIAGLETALNEVRPLVLGASFAKDRYPRDWACMMREARDDG